MRKIKIRLIIIAIALCVLAIPSISNAANVSIGKVKNVKIVQEDTSSIKLSWKGVKNATRYRIYVYNNSTKKYEKFGKTTKKEYTLTNLKTATPFNIKIRAYKTINGKNYYGKYSDAITGVTRPKKVKGLNATSQTDTTIDLTWNSVKRASGYRIYLYNESTKKYEKKATVSKNLVHLTNLPQAKTHKIKVRAYRQVNNTKYFGKYSEILTTYTKPSKITNLHTKTSSIDSITLTWNKLAGITKYQIYKYNISTGKYDKKGETTENSFLISGLDPATGYKYKVRAYMTFNGERKYGSYSDILSTATLPNRITDLKVSGVSEKHIEVKWSKVDKAQGYAVYVFRQQSQSYKLYKKTTSNSMKINDLDAARFYKIYVKAYATIDGKNYYSKASNTISKKTNSTEKEIAGIDVSVHNGNINWEKVKKAGVDFAILRCGYGQDDKSQDDKCFSRNISECKRLKIPYGVYLYSYALNKENALSEADHALRLLKGHNPEYGVWFDMEDADDYKKKHGMPPNKKLVEICVAFCDKMKSKGYKTGIYASLSWFNNQLNDKKIDKYEKWVAQWNDKCSYTKDYVMWQYTSDGMVDGISGRVDMNILYIKATPEIPVTPEIPETPEEPANPGATQNS